MSDVEKVADFMHNEVISKLNKLWQPAEIHFTKPFDIRNLKRTPSWRREIANGQKAISTAVVSKLHKVVSCPICGDSNSFAFVIIYGFHYRECCNCNHLYCSNPPDEGIVQNLYTGGEDESKKCIQTWTYLDKQNYETRIANIATPKVDFVGKYVKLSQGARWIDIGSGAGETLAAASAAGWQAIGIECDPDECEFARQQGLEVVNKFVTSENVNTLLYGAKIVSLFNVLEHVKNPLELLSSVAGAINSGSYIVIEVPHHPSISSFSNCLFPEMSCRHIIPPDHLHVFTDQSLNYVTTANGLSAVGIWYFGQDYYDIISAAMANANIQSSSLYNMSMDLAPMIQPIIDRAGLADTMLFVGLKN